MPVVARFQAPGVPTQANSLPAEPGCYAIPLQCGNGMREAAALLATHDSAQRSAHPRTPPLGLATAPDGASVSPSSASHQRRTWAGEAAAVTRRENDGSAIGLDASLVCQALPRRGSPRLCPMVPG